MQSKERANLRGEAHHLQPLVHIGHQGVTDSVVRATDDLLRTRELVKVDVSRNLDAPMKLGMHDVRVRNAEHERWLRVRVTLQPTQLNVDLTE